MTDRPRIAFLGIGLMGRHQAQNLITSGYHVTAWNRTRSKAEALKGAVVAEIPAQAVAEADIVITMLENGPIVQQVLFEGVACAASALRQGAVLIDMSSIKPAEARNHAMRLAEQGVRYLDAPVSGGTGGAQTATLAIMAGGAASDFEAVRPVLDTMGRATHVGPVGSGQLAKLANQMIVGVTIAAVAEALALSAQGGADPAKVRAALMGGFADSRVLSLHGQRMIDRDFETRGRSVTHLKDLDNALATAQEFGFHGPLLDRVTALFRGLVDHEGDPDHSAVLLEIERINRR
ncbi:NAD(P)-dependent oxidoreductase [Roseobacter weihaiensis]|uniref:NAD(P)-dependent oxidoreductase n=1 Tax=Roseobacter weihaiensis TaxID=2763262 RepID=UPI001D09B7B9|nr:NAD(P)-dependent oxidoreductase [Roseobacter sp. H9]